jgi:hypothetical protein
MHDIKQKPKAKVSGLWFSRALDAFQSFPLGGRNENQTCGFGYHRHGHDFGGINTLRGSGPDQKLKFGILTGLRIDRREVGPREAAGLDRLLDGEADRAAGRRA